MNMLWISLKQCLSYSLTRPTTAVRTISRSKTIVPLSHVPYGEEGSGHYAANNNVPLQANLQAIPLILNALKKVTDVKKKSLYTICDYGTADGGNSMQLIRECLGHLKSVCPDAEVQVWYEDQPSNDFRSLFNRLHGVIEDPPSYLQDFQGVYVGAIGTQFYERCLPANSVDFAFSSTAVHWLSRPCTLKNDLWYMLSNDEAEKEAFKEQSAEDWETFLVHRAAELAPGGQAVIVALTVDEHGQYCGTFEEYERLSETMGSVWRNMAGEGIITQEEFEQAAFNFYFPTAEELAYPFESKDSPVWKSGLKLVSLEVKSMPCPIHQEWVQSGKPDDLQARQNHGAKFVNTLRVWSNHSMFAGLSLDRPEEDRRKIVDEFYKRLQDIVSNSPDRFAITTPFAFVHIMKQP